MPRELSNSRPRVLFRDITSRLDLVAFDFQRHLGLDLSDELPRRSWRWFANHVSQLLALDRVVITPRGSVPLPDTAIGLYFQPEED